MALSKETVISALQVFTDIEFEFSDADIQRIAERFNHVQSFQKKEYESSWSNQLDQIDEVIADRKEFSSVINNLILPNKSSSILPSFIKSTCKYDLGNFQETPGKNLVVLGGRYQLVDQNHSDLRIIHCLRSYLTPDVDTVVEFGAGWGKNLALLFEDTGRTDIQYISCEQSESGRKAFENIFKLRPDLRYQSYDFDFLSPSFDMLKDSNNILVYTRAAIEQISFLPGSFIDELLDAAEKVTIVFDEPIGWQRIPGLAKEAIQRMIAEVVHTTLEEALFKNQYTAIFRDEFLLQNAAAWAIFARYNINLLRMINRTVASGRAELIDIRYDSYGFNPMNPYTLAVLQKT